METKPSLDTLALFLAVADAGGLSGAARKTGASLPTLSRRMTDLEKSLGKRLFVRGRHRYALTVEGRGLAEEVEGLREISARFDRWRVDGRTVPRVRITAGLWTSRYLARTIREVWSSEDGWLPEFVASDVELDIARRAADIGIRNRRPEQTWLAGRRTVKITYAVYGSGAEAKGFIALPLDATTTPSGRWLRTHHGKDIVTTASDTRLALDLALSGIGRIVLPCFAGDGEKGLIRLSEHLEELTHDEWLVAHHDGRHDPPVRLALDALHRALVSSDRPAV